MTSQTVGTSFRLGIRNVMWKITREEARLIMFFPFSVRNSLNTTRVSSKQIDAVMEMEEPIRSRIVATEFVWIFTQLL